MNEENNNSNSFSFNNNDNAYYDDNSFNDNGIAEQGDAYNELPNANNGSPIQNFGKGLAYGVKQGYNSNNNPGLGLKENNNKNKKDPMKGQKESDNKGNPAKGQKDKEKPKNPLPGGMNKDKKDNNRNIKSPNNSQKKDPNKDTNKDKNKGFGPKSPNPFNKRGEGSKSVLGNKKESGNESDVTSTVGDAAKKGIKTLWTATPIAVKVSVISFALILFIALVIFTAIFGGTTAAITASMCGEESYGSSYNGEGYTGENNVKAFACSMQHPLAGKGIITSWSGSRWGSYHEGIDIGIPTGTKVYAVQAGEVVRSGDAGAYGNMIEIKHSDKLSTIYAHNSKLLVKKGDKVGKGQLIAKSGNTGRSTGPHLHIEIRYNGKAQYSVQNDYFKKDFKKNCGSSWDGELAGDSANEANNPDNTFDDSSMSNEECCDDGGSSSSESVEGLPPILTQEFVDGAISTQTKYKVPASLTLAQIIQESSGSYPGHLSGLAYDCKNLFGIKGTGPAGHCNFKTMEESNGNNYSIYANFRKYKNYKQSIEDHGKFFKDNSRYSDCFNKKTGDEWAKCIHKAGYATDSKYSTSLINNMKKYNLYQYDEYTSYNQCVLGNSSFNGKIWYYDQTDYNDPYGSYGTIATDGCGPTAMAIVVSSLLNEGHDPVELTKYACSNNYCTSTGTKNEFFAAAGKKYGLKVKTLSKKNASEIFPALNSGNAIVIALMGPGTFTKGGHFITLTGSKSDQVFVHDPNNGDDKGYNKLWDFNKVINKEAISYWIITKSK